MTSEKPCIDVIGLARCTGCFGCQSACDVGAVELLLDADGFYKPIVDREKCNTCGVCQQRCPVILDQEGKLTDSKWAEPKAYAAWASDEHVRLTSSSGGIFSELARPVIDAGGAVAGCVWGDNWSPKHILARTETEVVRMRGSKYGPSRVGDVYQQIIALLRDSQVSVLFSGTPCQVAAMEATLAPDQRKRVLLVEVICHGVPSLRVFHRYLEEIFEGDEVASYSFRDKTFGWQTVKAISAHGKRLHVAAPNDSFFQGFASHHLYLMDACYECPFARLPRAGDITLGDFWSCPEQWYDKRGVSVVLVNTQAGIQAMESVYASGRISLKPANLAEVLVHSRRVVMGTYPRPSERRLFLDDLARGNRFVNLKARYFPTRYQLWWGSFQKSDTKWRFLAAFLYHRLRRFF